MQAEAQTYNGWTNYATWGVALVLDSDRATYETVREEAQRVSSGVEEYPALMLSDYLKDFTEELCGLEDDEDHLSLMARQVISAGLAEVNWREIAENILSES